MQSQNEFDKRAIARDVHSTLSQIPGATFYNAAEMAIDAVVAHYSAACQSANVAQGAEVVAQMHIRGGEMVAWINIGLHEGQNDLYAAPPAQAAITDDAYDAARYRWLKDAKDDFDLMGRHSYYATKLWNVLGLQEDWDATIDAALTAARSALTDRIDHIDDAGYVHWKVKK